MFWIRLERLAQILFWAKLQVNIKVPFDSVYSENNILLFKFCLNFGLICDW